jgi:hypothetical protein
VPNETEVKQPEQALAKTDTLSRPEAQAIRGSSAGAITFAPRTYAEAVHFSKLAATTDMVPKDYRGQPEKIFLAIQMGAEVGLTPMQAIQNIAVINGRPSLWGDAVLAIVQAHKDYEWHAEKFEGEGQARAAVCTIKRRNQPEYTVRFSMADAIKAGLTNKKDTPWQTYPDRMLQMRARSWALRDKFADALKGIGVAEEIQDYPGTTIEAQPEQQKQQDPLETQAIELMKAKGFNEAQRNAKLDQYQGRLPELIEKITNWNPPQPTNGHRTAAQPAQQTPPPPPTQEPAAAHPNPTTTAAGTPVSEQQTQKGGFSF